MQGIPVSAERTNTRPPGIEHYLIPGGEFPGIIEIFKTKISDVGFFNFFYKKTRSPAVTGMVDSWR